MERETFERALHLWPEWHESISKSRKELDYDPRWPVERAVAWIEAHYSNRVRPTAEAELRRLNLPPNLLEYWEDCFYCDYFREDGSTDFERIRRRIAVEEMDSRGQGTGRWVPANKSLPRLPYEAGLTWYDGEDTYTPWLRVEVRIFGPMVSDNLLHASFSQAWQTLKHMQTFSRLGAFRPHALTGLIVKAKANRSERKRRAVERYQKGEIDFMGLIEEEWCAPEVQEEAGGIAGKASGFERQKALLALQKKVYDRVRRRLPDPKPKLRSRGRWRDRLRLPGEPRTDTGN
ncbi:MAG: hypothetical protein ACE5MI_13765, partial [Acidimicrobiia bacterium]